MKDKFFKYFEVLIKYPKVLSFFLTLAIGGGGLGVFEWGGSAYAGDLKTRTTELKAEKGALKIYADMAYNCPTQSFDKAGQLNDTHYIEAYKTYADKVMADHKEDKH